MKTNQAFVDIYQLKDDAPVEKRFMGSKWLEENGLKPDLNDYEVVFFGTRDRTDDINEMLERLYAEFNVDIPDGYKGRSMSVSDIVGVGLMHYSGGLTVDVEWRAYYVDNIGFKELDDFFPQNAVEMGDNDEQG